MSEVRGYILGQSACAARRLEIQDAHFADVSEQLLDELSLKPGDLVVELGCGPGGFSRRILRRLGKGGVLIGVDASESLLGQARATLASAGPAEFKPVLADISRPGPWLENADVVLGRILTAEQIDQEQQALRTLSPESLPAAWGIYRVAAEV